MISAISASSAVHLIVVLVAVFGFMIVESRRARRNERAQRARSGVEPPGDVYTMMRVAYPGAFLAMIGENVWRGDTSSWWLGGVMLFVAAKALKWWAITTLGPAWTFRVIVVPGAPLVRSGPYRFVRHPNYVAVVGELVATALMTGARVTGPIATLAFAVLIARRISVERHALNAILRQHLKRVDPA